MQRTAMPTETQLHREGLIPNWTNCVNIASLRPSLQPIPEQTRDHPASGLRPTLFT
jgi:hypothetical protein